MKKRPVGRPEKTDEEKVKSVSRCITFKKDTFGMLEEMRGHEPYSSFIDRLVKDKYTQSKVLSRK